MRHSFKLFVFTFTLLTSSLNAQVSVEGIVRNKATGEPVPYAHILIDKTNSGTVSNDLGEFKLVHTSNTLTVKISCIGYETTLATLSTALTNTIFLKPAEAVLREIVVLAHDYAKELVRQAVASIGQNYVRHPEMITGFMRNGAYKEVGSLNPYYLIESVLEIEKSSYQDEVKSGNVKVVQARKYESEALDSLDVRFYNSHHIGHWGDMVASRRGPLNVRHLEGYDYSIIDTLTFDGKDLYQVQFRPAKKVAGSGMLYIQAGSFAIVKMQLQYNREELVGIFSSWKEAAVDRYRLFERYTAEYVRSESAWRLSRLEFSTAFERKNKPDIFLKDYFVATKAAALEASIPYGERIGYHDIFLDETGRYDPNFWRDYTIVLPTEMEAAAFEKTSAANNELNSKTERLMATLSRFRLTLGVGMLPNKVNGVDAAFQQDAFWFQEQIVPNNIYVWGLTGSTEFELTPNLIVGFGSVSSFQSKRYAAIWGKMGWESQFASVATRPFYVDVSVRLGYVDQRYRFGSYQTDGIEVKGRQLNSETLDVFLVQRAWSAVPSIRISGEKTKRLRFFAEAGRNFYLTSTDGLVLQEKQFWFKKAAFVPAGATGLDFQKNSKWSIDNVWCLNAGVMISF